MNAVGRPGPPNGAWNDDQESSGALIEIDEVLVASPAPPPGLRGGHIDLPRSGQRVEARALDVAGWALGDGAEAIAVELWCEDALVRRAPLAVARPDLAEGFPEVPEAGRAGFRTSVSAYGRSARVEIEVRVVLADQRRVRLGAVRGRRTWREGAERLAPLISVVIPCYDQAHFLGEAIESVLAQSYPHFEIVVVDDGSRDNAAAVAGAYPGVQVLRQPNQGLAAARNAGLRASRGDYLVFLDADDRLLPNALETGLAALREHPECAFAAGHYRYVDLDGSVLPTSPLAVVRARRYETLLRYNWIGMPATVIFRRGPILDAGGFAPAPVEDYDLCLRLAQRLDVHSHGEIVAEYRQQPGGMSRDPGRMLAAALRVLRRQRRPFIRSWRHRDARRSGRRTWRAYYGEPLVNDTRTAIAEGRWPRVARGALDLALHHPRGLAALPGSAVVRIREGSGARASGE